MVFPNDIAVYKVSYKKLGKMITHEFKTFAAAAGCADALDSVVRLLDVSFTSPEGDSCVSGTLYIYGRDNARRIGSKHLVKAVTERKGA